MGMLHSSSGKHFYDLYYEPTSYIIPKPQMKRILIREDELRKSSEIQARYSEKDDLDHFKNVTRDLQHQALLENGVAQDDLPEALKALNNARSEYVDDPEMNKLTVYQRLDISRWGDQPVGVTVMPIELVTMNGKTIRLDDYYREVQSKRGDGLCRPMIILAGSIS